MVSGIMQILCIEQHTENTLTWRMNDGYLLLWEGGRLLLLLLLQHGNRFPPGKRTRDREQRAFCAFECVYCSGECEIVLWRHNPYEDKSEVIICSHPVSVVGATQNILCFCSFYCCCCVEMFRGVSNLP